MGNPPCLDVSKIWIAPIPLDPAEMLAIHSVEVGVSGPYGLDEAQCSLLVPKLGSPWTPTGPGPSMQGPGLWVLEDVCWWWASWLLGDHGLCLGFLHFGHGFGHQLGSLLQQLGASWVWWHSLCLGLWVCGRRRWLLGRRFGLLGTHERLHGDALNLHGGALGLRGNALGLHGDSVHGKGWHGNHA